MSTPRLIYFADPMCSWCWGFAPAIEAIRAIHGPDLPVTLILGGLRPGTTAPMSARMKETIRGHWTHVAEASGQPFDMAFFDRPAFIYDTEPAARAVVAARRLDETTALPVLAAVQQAFYAFNRDVTDARVLADIAAECGLSREAFTESFENDETKTETWSDFTIAQRTGITGFPTLIAGFGDGRPWTLITQGFQKPGAVLTVLERWLQSSASVAH